MCTPPPDQALGNGPSTHGTVPVVEDCADDVVGVGVDSLIEVEKVEAVVDGRAVDDVVERAAVVVLVATTVVVAVVANVVLARRVTLPVVVVGTTLVVMVLSPLPLLPLHLDGSLSCHWAKPCPAWMPAEPKISMNADSAISKWRPSWRAPQESITVTHTDPAPASSVRQTHVPHFGEFQCAPAIAATYGNMGSRVS